MKALSLAISLHERPLLTKSIGQVSSFSFSFSSFNHLAYAIYTLYEYLFTFVSTNADSRVAKGRK